MTSDIPTNQDVIHANIIKTRKNYITNLEQKRDNIVEEIKIEKDFLEAFQKISIPVISKQLGVRK